jgi:homoserine dehydrogenase
MDKNYIGVGLMGLGTVAGQTARILTDKSKLKVLSEAVGLQLILKKVKVIESDLARPVAADLGPWLLTIDEEEFFKSDIDIVVEAIGGENPAFRYQKRALESGKYVVTSNKEVIAKHAVELLEIAREHGVGLYYEASVGGGVPLIVPLQRDLVANKIKSIHAIINGTTNYILTRMAEEGVDFAAALKKAQELGYAEADPRNDVEGVDATYKLAILSSLAFNCQVRPENIYCEGISRLNSRDFQYAKELGFAVKLLAIGRQEDSLIQVRVHPVFIPEDSMLAKVSGVFNAIRVEGDLVGKLLFYGQGAGAFPTSSAVVSDIVSSAKDIICGSPSLKGWRLDKSKSLKPISDLETRYYIRLDIADKPGVLAQIASALGDQSISIYSAIQKETNEVTHTAEIVIMTHVTREDAVQRALKVLNTLPIVKQVNNCVRVEYIS